MSGFRLLAIRPLSGCPKSISKVLNSGEIYQFYADVIIEDAENEKGEKVVKLTESDSIKNVDIYSTEDLKINISAIVGKNGSGKSSVLDLFYLFCYSISVAKGYISDIDKQTQKEIDEGKREHLEILDSFFLYEKLSCEVYYQIGDDYFQTSYSHKKINHFKYQDNKWKPEGFEFPSFFYTIGINYSLYGLNSRYDVWLNALFHKNDGYKIPVVINPYRIQGNIDVNSELHLAQSRTFLNLASQPSNNPVIVNSKKMAGLLFELNVRDNDSIKFTEIQHVAFWSVFKRIEKDGLKPLVLFNKLAKEIGNYELSEVDISLIDPFLKLDTELENTKRHFYEGYSKHPEYGEIKFQLVKYVLRKIIKIAIHYPSDVGLSFSEKENMRERTNKIVKNIDAVINEVIKDKSHITLKLRQAIFTIKEDFFNESKEWDTIHDSMDKNYRSYQLFVPWSDVKSTIETAIGDNEKELEKKLDVIPGAFVKPTIVIENKEQNIANYHFHGLSSGEQHLSNTLQTIFYHIYNLNSVHKSHVVKKEKYHYLNVILDEIELYFHPEYQRVFIKNLIELLDDMDLEFIEGINFIFSTHSPFILSDIPSHNVLRLEDGESKPFQRDKQTFGANIYDLLNDQFFFKNGFIGEMAKNHIEKLLTELYAIADNRKRISSDKFIELKTKVELVGERIIRTRLEDILNDIPNEYFDLEQEINKAEKLVETLKQRRR